METMRDSYPTWKEAACHGAGVGARMTLLYASVFLLYAIARSSIELSSMPAPESGAAGTLLATAASLTVATSAITLLLMPVSVLAGVVASLLLHRLLSELGRARTLAGTFIISLAVAFATADTVQFIFLPLLGFEPLKLPFETWIFWFGLPSIVYIVAIGLEGAWLRPRRSFSPAAPSMRKGISDQWR